MNREILHYLDERARQSIEGWCEAILPLFKKYPILGEVDFVIEGGVGTGKTMVHIARRLFPEALYVGTDIAERLIGGRRRLSGSIDNETLNEVRVANKNPSLSMQGAVIYANCFDNALVKDIARRTDRQHPLLVSHDALNALVDRKMNPWDRKNENDMISLEQMIDAQSPYIGQLHIGVFWEDTTENDRIYEKYFRLERVAQRAGWIIERFDCGLLLLRPLQS